MTPATPQQIKPLSATKAKEARQQFSQESQQFWQEDREEGNPLQNDSSWVSESFVSKTGRNDPCPCGSGKKYKKCCGKLVFIAWGLDPYKPNTGGDAFTTNQ